jgi:hypothetical protein
MFFLGLVGQFAAHDVVREENNFLEGEITLLEPRAVLDGPGLRTLRPSNVPSTPATKHLRNIRICAPHHITTTGIALHLTMKQAHVF